MVKKESWRWALKNSHHQIDRRTFILGQTMLSAAALAPSTAYAQRRDSSPVKEASNWLQEDLVPIRSLDPTDETYDDLEPLASAIGPARLVLLGESSHGAGSDFKAKVRLIKFLCQRMDFDVIVWESGFHAMDQVNAALRSTGDPVAAAKRGIFTIWSDTREVEPLFKWVQSSWLSRRPIEMAGFDAQITAAGAEGLLFEDMRQFAGSCPDPEVGQRLKEDVERAIAAFKKTSGSSASAGDVAAVNQAAGDIVHLIDRHRRLLEQANSGRRISFMERALENFRCFAELRYEASQGTPGTVGVQLKDPTTYFDTRDAENARNIRWLLDVGYPGRKIIVWAHNVHICKLGFSPNFGSLTQQPRQGDMLPMGRLIASQLPDDCYAIGFTSYDGDASWATAPKPTPIPPAPPDSLEARLHSTGRPFAFVNLRGRKSWGENISTQRIFVPSPGDSSTKSNGIFSVAKTPNLFDGIFFIDQMTPATPIGSR
jgi:erythromycin esterase